MKRKRKEWILLFLMLALLVTACERDREERPLAIPAAESVEQTDMTSEAAHAEETKIEETEPTTETPAEPAAQSEKAAPDMLEIAMEMIEETEGSRPMIRTAYVRPYLVGEDAERYPELQAALEQYSLDAKQPLADRRKELQGYRMDEKNIDGEYLELVDERTGTVVRADSSVVSIEILHRYTDADLNQVQSRAGINYDPITGRELAFSDVVSDVEHFVKQMDEKLQTVQEPINETIFKDRLANFKEQIDSDISWSISPEGVTVYLEQQRLGYDAGGEQSLTVYFDEKPDIFAAKYLEAPTDYIMKYDAEKSVFLDADGDGAREQLEISLANAGEEDLNRDHYRIAAGAREVIVENGSYDMSAYLVRSNEQYYLYLAEMIGSDDSILTVVDLKTMTCGERDGFEVEPRVSIGVQNTENGWSSRDMYISMTDPKHIPVGRVLNILSTMRGYQYGHVGTDGTLVINEPWYRTQPVYALKVKKDLSCDLVDSEGVAAEDPSSLAADTFVHIVRTDGASWVDVQIADKSEVAEAENLEALLYPYDGEFDPEKPIYRITFDNAEYPRTVDGVSEEELFAGMIYAG